MDRSTSPRPGAEHLPIYATAPSGTLVDEARVVLEQDPERVMVIEGDHSLTVRELWGEASSLARFFRERGLKAGDVVAMQLPNWAEASSLYLAASMMALVLNPILPILRDSEVKFVLHDSRSKLIFIPSEFRGFDYHGMIKRIRADLPELATVVVLRGEAEDDFAWADLVRNTDPEITLDPVDPDSVKIVMYVRHDWTAEGSASLPQHTARRN
jgi:non-ribosomal peptide synthetase component E (peptide arylation enzyme)